ncbi:MAG: peptidoglycan-binding domain-containing protein [Candidatus Omnitrophica bacterium]|jgi:peptidoglycan hydrolase-like protein with peptidoglycan-binding domain|nr:peptidoglycan-binding protein [Candidatus Omnitrophota bacterium]MDD5079447.1 peptidoglycan-binding domain-containing protein [Candidatus Omnitrophota bacterium]
MRVTAMIIVSLFFAVSGCVTTLKSPERQSYEQTIAQLQAKSVSLEAELYKQKGENASLKRQVAGLQKKEVRMPNGREIQTALKNGGFYKGAIDGQIGSQTKDAVKKFQQANGMNPDGVVGSKTWAVLVKYLEDRAQ